MNHEYTFFQDPNTSGEETTDGTVEETGRSAPESHPRGKPTYAPRSRGRGRGAPRSFRGRFIRRGGGGGDYRPKYLDKEGSGEREVNSISTCLATKWLIILHPDYF